MKFIPCAWDSSRTRREILGAIYGESKDLMFSYCYLRQPRAQNLLGQIPDSTRIWIDSSGFQVGYGRAPKPSIFDIVDLQKNFGDVGFTLDFPTEPEQTYLNAVLSLAYNRGQEEDDVKMYAVVAHNGSPETATQLARKYQEHEFDGLAVGGQIPFGSSDPGGFVSIVSAIMRVSTKPLHVFGVGGFDTIYLLALLGVSSFDSSRFISAARSRHFLTPHGTLYVGNRYTRDRNRRAPKGEIPCQCPVCSKVKSLEYFQEPMAEAVANLALHNYYVMKNEVRLIQIAQEERWFPTLLEGRARKSPRLRAALREIRKDFFVKGAPKGQISHFPKVSPEENVSDDSKKAW